MVEATNGLSAKVGDTVKLEMNSASFLLLAFIGYILPILICIATYFSVHHFTGNVVVSDIAAIISLVGVIVIFFVIDKIPRKSTRFSSRIIKIIR